MPEVTVAEFLTRYRNKHDAYYDVEDDVLLEAVLQKYPVYKDKLSDYTSPEDKARNERTEQLVEKNNPWLQDTQLTNPWNADELGGGLNPLEGVQDSPMALAMQKDLDARIQRSRDVLSTYRELDPKAEIKVGDGDDADGQDVVIDSDMFFMDDDKLFKHNNSLDDIPKNVDEFSLDPVIRKKQLDDLKNTYSFIPNEMPQWEKEQTEQRLLGQPIDRSAVIQEGEFEGEDYSSEGNKEVVSTYEAMYGPGAKDVKTLFGGLNYRETIENPIEFSQWLYDAKVVKSKNMLSKD